jgi:small subunit ribosomal protein S2
MTLPAFSMSELMEAGVHFGHKTKRWNPRMAPFIYGVRNDIHIINLGKTAPMLRIALQAIRDTAATNGRILFVGTKRQASDPIAEAAKRCGQYYINQRWLGGLLTNWRTIQASIKRLRKIEELQAGNVGFTKKEMLSMSREKDKLEASLGGIKDMGGVPDLIFVIDTIKEELAIKEAQKLGIPIVAIIDSNCTVDGINFPIPGNDDSTRAIKLYCQLVSDAVLAGIQQSVAASPKDIGESAEPTAEMLKIEGMNPSSPETGSDAASEKPESDKGKGRGKKGAAPKKAPVVAVKKSRKVEE